MKKLIAMFAMVLGLSFQAQATQMAVELDKATYQINEQVTAQLKIFGYTDGISVYQFDLQYLLSALDLLNVSFGPYLTTTPSFQDFYFNADDSLTVSEFNTDFTADLAAIQSADFTVATLTFKALQAGQFNLDLVNGFLGDMAGNMIDPVELSGAQFTVQSADVPAPATALLLLSALLLRRRRQA